ncbi:MAG: alpha/beta hydrolase [marine bacterium B5-7]|nr:MAG: alpha/beta hydrolase [marine bacterium B5-7]
MNTYPNTEQTMLLRGPAGDLEVVAAPGEADKPLVVICHPHPLYGGTMDNKVVTTTYRTFRDRGHPVVRFNFRGVGNSEGEYAQGDGEMDDCRFVLDWAREQLNQPNFILAGFSFGSYVAAHVAEDWDADPHFKKLISIAPPVNHFSFAKLSFQTPWLILMGDDDEVVPSEQVYKWVKSITPAPTLVRFAETSHFFHGKLVDLREALLGNVAVDGDSGSRPE